MSLNGLVVMTPTSIASTGTANSSSIGADGKVTFSLCTGLSLNGVFTSSYENYMVVIRGTSSSAVNIWWRLRQSGTDNQTASSYVLQTLFVSDITASTARLTQTYGELGAFWATRRAGITAYFFGPFLTQPTAVRSLCVRDGSGAQISDIAQTHNQSASYDGFSITLAAGPTISGAITVYGFNQ